MVCSSKLPRQWSRCWIGISDSIRRRLFSPLIAPHGAAMRCSCTCRSRSRQIVLGNIVALPAVAFNRAKHPCTSARNYWHHAYDEQEQECAGSDVGRSRSREPHRRRLAESGARNIEVGWFIAWVRRCRRRRGQCVWAQLNDATGGNRARRPCLSVVFAETPPMERVPEAVERGCVGMSRPPVSALIRRCECADQLPSRDVKYIAGCGCVSTEFDQRDGEVPPVVSWFVTW